MNEIGYLLAFLCGSTVIYAVWSMVRDTSRQATEKNLPVLPFISESKTQEQVLAENLAKALKFESYITSKFNSAYFRLLDWRSDKNYHGIFPLSSLYPDLKYEFVPNAVYFAVECKWRKKFYNEGVDVTPDQLNRYLKYQQCFDENVFIVIGVGGSPDLPENLYVVPLSDVDVNSTFLSFVFLSNYKKNPAGDFYFDAQLRRLN